MIGARTCQTAIKDDDAMQTSFKIVYFSVLAHGRAQGSWKYTTKNGQLRYPRLVCTETSRQDAKMVPSDILRSL